MAKFVLTTWAACLARQNPVSTRAKPACMKITKIAPMTTHSMLICPPRAVTGSTSVCPGARPNKRLCTSYLRTIDGAPADPAPPCERTNPVFRDDRLSVSNP